MSKLVKYLLFITNILIFFLALAVCGVGIWVLVDKPSFLDLFEQAQQISEISEITDGFDIEIYTSAAYILIAVSGVVALISFFGCCGAVKENKCMLGTYFTLILAMFIVMVVGAVLGYSGSLEKAIKSPLKSALELYDDSATEQSNAGMWAYKNVWNEVQKELKCCGVDDVRDWGNSNHNWNVTDANKPVGCCLWKQDGTEITNEEQKVSCRKAPADANDSTYYFRGCYTMIKEEIENHQNIVVGIAIGVVVIMFLNMMFSFAMCTMVK